MNSTGMMKRYTLDYINQNTTRTRNKSIIPPYIQYNIKRIEIIEKAIKQTKNNITIRTKEKYLYIRPPWRIRFV